VLQEEQLLELVMNGMRVAGIALALQALSTVALGEAPTLEQSKSRPPVQSRTTVLALRC
jgi:hypothetical protein